MIPSSAYDDRCRQIKVARARVIPPVAADELNDGKAAPRSRLYEDQQ